jgi:hypothetical protein
VTVKVPADFGRVRQSFNENEARHCATFPESTALVLACTSGDVQSCTGFAQSVVSKGPRFVVCRVFLRRRRQGRHAGKAMPAPWDH